jgi:hypothetical protein
MAVTGKPVMCCIIFTSESSKEIPVNWITGIDLTKIDATFEVDQDKEETIKMVRLTGAVSGGPTCLSKTSKYLVLYNTPPMVELPQQYKQKIISKNGYAPTVPTCRWQKTFFASQWTRFSL